MYPFTVCMTLDTHLIYDILTPMTHSTTDMTIASIYYAFLIELFEYWHPM